MSIPTFVHTITLFNKLEDRSGGRTAVSWHKTVLNGCYFGAVRGEKHSGTVLSENDTFICRIPENKGYTAAYKGIPGTFTLAPGDIIVKGCVKENIEDKAGSRAADILNSYKESFTVKSFSDNTVLSSEPHYRASG